MNNLYEQMKAELNRFHETPNYIIGYNDGMDHAEKLFEEKCQMSNDWRTLRAELPQDVILRLDKKRKERHFNNLKMLEDARNLAIRLLALEEETQEAEAQELARESIEMLNKLISEIKTLKS